MLRRDVRVLYSLFLGVAAWINSALEQQHVSLITVIPKTHMHVSEWKDARALGVHWRRISAKLGEMTERWGKHKDKRMGREGENPLLFFQSEGVVLLTGWFIRSPLLHVPISSPQPPSSTTHPPFFHSFFLWAACGHGYLEMTTDTFRQAELLEWLTCTAVSFSSQLTLTVLFLDSARNKCCCFTWDVKHLLS